MAGSSFPDLKGQAPLRPDHVETDPPAAVALFLTSKVRLHCDTLTPVNPDLPSALFLTSKVRLHCDPSGIIEHSPRFGQLFLTSKVRLHCDGIIVGHTLSVTSAFPDLKGQAPLRPSGL